MSLRTTYQLRCDDCGATSPDSTTNRYELQTLGKARGWQFPEIIKRGKSTFERMDLCPACWEKRQTKQGQLL